MKKLLVVLLVVSFGIVGCLFAMRSRSVLYRYFLVGNPSKEPEFAIFNPFRDRQPETSAAEFLTSLQNGDCKSVMRELSQSYSAEYQQTTCEKDQTNGLLSWKLTNRTDEIAKVSLYYRVWRKGSSGVHGNVWLTLDKAAGDWRVTRYDRAY